MIKLHFAGSVFELRDDYSVADVAELMDNYTAGQDGHTWFHLADGNTVWLRAGNPSVYAIESDEKSPKGLTSVTRYPA